MPARPLISDEHVVAWQPCLSPDRTAANLEIIGFLNTHIDSFSSSEVKNGQGLAVIYSLHMLMEQLPQRTGFTLYEIADYIRRNKLWFKFSIKEENGIFSAGDGCLTPYISAIDGVREPTMYAEDKKMRKGRSRISNLIMNKLKSNVISPTRSHTMILRSVVDLSGNDTYCIHLRSESAFSEDLQELKTKMVPKKERPSLQWKGTHTHFDQ